MLDFTNINNLFVPIYSYRSVFNTFAKQLNRYTHYKNLKYFRGKWGHLKLGITKCTFKLHKFQYFDLQWHWSLWTCKWKERKMSSGIMIILSQLVYWYHFKLHPHTTKSAILLSKNSVSANIKHSRYFY